MTECATVPTEAEEHTTCPPLECDCTCPSTEVNNTECPTPGTYPECDCTCPSTEVNNTECPTLGTQSTGIYPECDCTRPTQAETDAQQNTVAVSCSALGAGLGTLAAVLMAILVGVVIVWVWSCYRNGNDKQ